MRETRKLVLACLCGVCLTAGCATAKRITGPDGGELISIDCSGYGNNMGNCLERAGKECGGRGYEILMGGTNNFGPMASSGTYGMFMAPAVSREIVIRCKNGLEAGQPRQEGPMKPF